jgi:hypothetical protein
LFEELDDPSHSGGSARGWGGKFRETLGKNPPFTLVVLAAPADQPRPDRDRRPLNRKIVERT